jgi:predicted ATPase
MSMVPDVDQPPPDTPALGGNNLPGISTRVVGRTEAIARVGEDVREARLVSIVGPGGIGKTTVALAAADKMVREFRGGVWLVDFAPLKDRSLVPAAIAAATGLAVHSANVMAALCNYLRGRHMLLVLDNCEHLVEDIARCAAQILKEAPDIHVLATSREPLRLADERIHRLPGLAAPPVTTTLNAETALTFPAIQLFVDRATDRLESFELSDADSPVLAEICRNLDGIALAIELAAMRVDVFGVGGLHRQLDDRFRLLGGRRAGLERHRTLAATLDWSYGLLADGEGAMLRAISIFPGSFRVADASAVAAVPVGVAVQMLASLVSKSLLTSDIDTTAGEVVYRLLETTRAFGLEKLLLQPEDSRLVSCRHAQHVADVLERAAREWAPSYGRYLDDIRVALAWAGGVASDRPLLIRLTLAGTVLWNYMSLTDESVGHLKRAIAALPAAGQTSGAIEMHLQLTLAGATLFTRGIASEAKGAMWRAYDLAMELGDTATRLGCLRLIGTYELFSGENDAGIATLESFVDLARQDDPSAVLEGESLLICGHLFVGRLLQVRQQLDEVYAQEGADEAQSLRFLYKNNIAVMIILAHVQWLTGSPDAAERTSGLLIAEAVAARHELSLSIALAWSCLTYFWSGNDEACARYSAQLYELVERHGIITWRPLATFCQGALKARNPATLAEGVAQLEATVAECKAIGHIARLPYFTAVLAEALARAGRHADARTAIAEALSLAAHNNDGWSLPELIRIDAFVFGAAGQPAQHEARLLEAIEQARRIGGLSWQLRAAADLARLWRNQSRTAEPRLVLQQVYDQFTEGLETPDLVEARQLLGELE